MLLGVGDLREVTPAAQPWGIFRRDRGFNSRYKMMSIDVFINEGTVSSPLEYPRIPLDTPSTRI
jgi:hypothetical protein